MVIQKYVLVVDDNVINRAILVNILSGSYSTLEAGDGEEALSILKKNVNKIAAVMLDLVMPVMDGFTFLEKIRENEEYQNIPIIVTTGNNDSENEIKALKSHAWDFVSKPYNADIIRFRLKNAVDRSQLSAFNQLKYLAEYDTLTGIYNKTKFFEITRQMLDENPEDKFVFIRFDIDRFQLINSFFGTDEGDKLLKFIANSIKGIEKMFTNFTYGRMESDIFCLCFTYDEKSLVSRLKLARKVLSNYNSDYDIVPSFGVYIIDDNELPVETIYNHASLASKKCKGNYIEFYAFYDEKMSQKLSTEQELTNKMTTALEKQHFVVYLQPKYSLRTNEPCGAEALVRWIHPEKGMISPGDFIPVFERNGFISKLDYYMWEKVCGLLRKWIDEGKTPTPVSVNVSRVNLYNPKFVDNIIALTKKYDIPPSLLNLELTESAYTDNPKVMSETMTRLQTYGFVIMMDDFGSGYSSLNVLKDIAVDVLKIDMGFLSESKIVGRGENIISSIIRMTKWLKIPVIAEGVETKEQAQFLHSIGCEYVQGYYFARPMPVCDYEQLMSKTFSHQSIEEKNEDNQFDTDSIWISNPQIDLLFSNVMQAVAICEFDREHIELLRVNNAFYNLHGYEENKLFSENLIEIIHIDYRESILTAFKKAVDTQDTAECEYLRNEVDNSLVWIGAKVKYVNDIGGKHILFVTFENITQQKQIDNELQRYRTAISTKNSEHHTMLIVDDMDTNRIILKEIFKNDYNILEAENGKQALSVLNDNLNSVDIILLDLMMPEMNGEEFLKHKRNTPLIESIPVVIITADIRADQQITTLSLGANDYIVKPFISEVVIRRVQNVIDSNIRFREVLKEYNLMAVKAQTDKMTGLYNRDVAEKMIKNILNEEDEDSIHAFIMIDIDDFKNINDRHGHSAGDIVLQKTSKHIKTFFQNDIAMRFGGDEFAVFVSQNQGDPDILERCLRFCREINAIVFEEISFNISCSVGIAYSDKDSDTFDTLCKKADEALYNSKDLGKNTASVYGNFKPKTSKWISNSKWILNEIDAAIYICNKDDYSMLYVNRYLCDLFKINYNDCIGKKCYEVLMNRDTPCDFCAVNDLNTDSILKRRFKFPDNDREFLISGKLVNRSEYQAHLEMAVDVTDIAKGRKSSVD